MQNYAVVVVGGGFFGCAIAAHLAGRMGPILIVEEGPELLKRASYVNQARLHTGYHYPRSFKTAASSLANRAVFESQYEACVDRSFTALYAIARSHSKVSRRHFERFSRTLGMPLRPASKALTRLFSPKLIDGVYECEEYAFNADALRTLMKERIEAGGVEVRLETPATRVEGPGSDGRTVVSLRDQEPVSAQWVLNCTYSRLNNLEGLDPTNAARLKHQITEVCLVDVPDALKELGVTVMDGGFFSVMPFPARKLHSLTHVRYTPHMSWFEDKAPDPDPYRVLTQHARQTQYAYMKRDATRYMPSLDAVEYADTLFEVKTVLVDSSVDDARPIVFHRDESNPQIISILGGKIDNIFDVLEVIDREVATGQ